MKNKLGGGFSLIEVLVVVSVLAVLSVMMVDLLSRTLQGSNKTQLLGDIKQNGQTALNTMDTTIQYSDQVFCVGTLTSSNDTIIMVKSGVYTRLRFYKFSGVTSNGYIGQYTVPQSKVSDPTTLNSTLCSDPDTTGEVKLTSDDLNSGVSLQSGSFSYTPNPAYKDVVGISFSLGPSVKAPPSFDNQSSAVSFSTTVEVR